jgi:hypothetical protein
LQATFFSVVALDGNPLPEPVQRQTLELAPAERIDTIVEMHQPGLRVFGEIDDKVRKDGLGIVVEYAGCVGEPRWVAPTAEPWTYTVFGKSAAPVGALVCRTLTDSVSEKVCRQAMGRQIDNQRKVLSRNGSDSNP